MFIPRGGFSGSGDEAMLGERMKKRKQQAADILLLAAVLGVGLLLAVLLLLTRREGAEVQVRVAGRVIHSFPLDKNAAYTITGVDGGKNLLVIQNGYAWIEEADCPDALCVGMGRIRRVGQSVVCLPHKVVVEIVGAADDTGVDIVVG